MAKRVYARRPHQYGGKELDRGQVIELSDLRNDEKLIRLGYLAEVPKNTTLKECGECGEKFVDEDCRNGHCKDRHDERFQDLSPEEEDEREIAREKKIEAVAPLFLDKTKASREAGA